ncbi:unannotated protein [freshwater metagenome]|uniref:Unannotated protein n=1 Tax=freshwater metagenome TaxID=449393 RepID=A0A6J7K349_9ZZZZ
MYLSRIAGLDNQANSRASLFANEVMMNSAGEQQRRNRCHFCIGAAIRENEHGCSGLDRIRGKTPNVPERLCQPFSPGGDRIETRNHDSAEIRRTFVICNVNKCAELVVVENRSLDNNLAA